MLLPEDLGQGSEPGTFKSLSGCDVPHHRHSVVDFCARTKMTQATTNQALIAQDQKTLRRSKPRQDPRATQDTKTLFTPMLLFRVLRGTGNSASAEYAGAVAVFS